jgi:hypothetical protein
MKFSMGDLQLLKVGSESWQRKCLAGLKRGFLGHFVGFGVEMTLHVGVYWSSKGPFGHSGLNGTRVGSFGII